MVVGVKAIYCLYEFETKLLRTSNMKWGSILRAHLGRNANCP